MLTTQSSTFKLRQLPLLKPAQLPHHLATKTQGLTLKPREIPHYHVSMSRTFTLRQLPATGETKTPIFKLFPRPKLGQTPACGHRRLQRHIPAIICAHRHNHQTAHPHPSSTLHGQIPILYSKSIPLYQDICIRTRRSYLVTGNSFYKTTQTLHLNRSSQESQRLAHALDIQDGHLKYSVQITNQRSRSNMI